VNLPVKQYDENDLAKARRRGKFVGWMQGAGVVVVGGIVLNLLGWIPLVIGVGAVGYVAYRLLGGSSKDASDGAPEG